MFDNVIDSARAAITPVAQEAAAALESYAERIIARLDAIEEAVSDEEYEQRHMQHTYWNLKVGDNRKIDIPADCFLDYLLITSPVGGSSWSDVRVTTGATLLAAMVPRFNALGAAQSALGVFVHAGAEVTVSYLSAGTPGEQVTVMLQFVERTPRKAKRAHGRGERQLYNQFERLNEPERHMPGIDGSLIKAGSGGEGLGSNNA